MEFVTNQKPHVSFSQNIPTPQALPGFFITTRKNGLTLPFQMDDATQAALICGGDETLNTLEYAKAIRAFEAGLDNGMRVSVIK